MSLLSATLWGVGVCLARPAEVGELSPPADRWVLDEAQVLPEADEARIDAVLQRLDAARRAQAAVVTVESVRGTPKGFATELFNAWGLGREGVDDGLLVLLVVDARRLEMETGYGLEEALPDGWLGLMQADRMVPRFKAGDYAAGILAGLEAVEARLAEGGPPPRPLSDRAGDAAVAALASPVTRGVLGLGALGLVGALVVRRRRARHDALPRCPDCEGVLVLVDEDREDRWLSEAQQAEEKVGGMDHSVWLCTDCEAPIITSEQGFDRAIGECEACLSRAVRFRSTVVREPPAPRRASPS